MKIVLASASPRRRELFVKITPEFITAADKTPEVTSGQTEAKDVCLALAQAKSEHIFSKYPDCAVVGCDTVVALGSRIFGKPADIDDARNMLKSLSGATHTVYTGVCILTPGGRSDFVCATDVEFHPLDDDTIEQYISTAEPYDKAGGYGIQDNAALFVKSIRGDYFNVVGLPLSLVYIELKKLGAL